MLKAATGTLVLVVSATFSAQTSPAGFHDGRCVESVEVNDRPPDDVGASSFASPGATWYANDARTMWAWWWGKKSDGGYKVLWIRPPGMPITVTGKRLDSPEGKLTADLSGGYPNTYQTSGLYFSSPGCWQIDATAAGRSMTFVTRIP
jgi:hypothetical protein